MAYTVHPLLHELEKEIIEGLRSGKYVRHGGVIRVAPGQEGAGQFKSFLREMDASQLNESLGGIMQMSQVAAAASVINVGVSVVGFSIMAGKLNRLQGDMTRVIATLDRNQEAVMSEFADVRDRLVELSMLGHESRELLFEAIDEVRQVQKDLMYTYFAKMATEWSLMARGSAADAMPVLRTFRESRLWLEATIDDRQPWQHRPHLWFDQLSRYRLWCGAVQGEVALLRRTGESEEAQMIAAHAADRSRVWASRWRMALAPQTEFEGIYRYGYSEFNSLPGETRWRLIRLESGGDHLPIDRERERRGALMVASARNELPDEWTEKQLGIARVLDFAEEATERFESMRDELAFCTQRRLNFDQWEGLPMPTNATGMALIHLDQAS